MELDMDETYFTTVRPAQQHDRQTSDSRRRTMQISRRPALSNRSRRPPIHHINLTGFICEPNDPEYAAAAKATGTKGNIPIYWFKQYGYQNSLYNNVDAVHEIDTMSQAERDVILYPHTVEKTEAASVKTKPSGKTLTSSLRNLMNKGKKKKVQFLEQAMEDEDGQPLSKPEEEGPGCDNTQVEMDEEPEWM